MTLMPRSGFADAEAAAETRDYVTVLVDGQLFGLPIECVHDVFIASEITPVPLAPPEVAGLLNLRGRVVTTLSLRRILRLEEGEARPGRMVVGVEYAGESFGLAVDGVGEVLSLSVSDLQLNPINLDPRWARIAKGVHWLENGLLVVIDIEAVLGSGSAEAPRASAFPPQKGFQP
ncbi:chemotaxis protein CheW [Alsobacter soli]|uniref:Chemotaxis protein CheW n=1 Tax=Alsobacter soli TaxID=2109933 RepID=A0A2T1HZ67_9HYPH|nr:chemotaxis protein CheW [Alsobacter soli]PSC06915.1 chemotaxis protein CheW [Alsobacter soli]